MNVKEISPNAVLLKSAQLNTVSGRVFNVELYDNTTEQYLVFSTKDPDAQSVLHRELNNDKPKWTTLTHFISEIKESAHDMADEAIGAIQWSGVEHLAIVERNPSKPEMFYVVERHEMDEEATAQNKLDGLRKMKSAYRDENKVYFQNSMIDLVHVPAITDDIATIDGKQLI